MIRQVKACRVCGNPKLERVLDLGVQSLTGVFPGTVHEKVTSGPLRLVKCRGGTATCGLVQLEHSYDLSELYGDNYGYRSGLNAAMVRHLTGKVADIIDSIDLQEGDLVVDIGSNDSTTLKAYPDVGLTLVGVDPTGEKFREFYPDHVDLIPDFFSSEAIRKRYADRRAKVITSFSMFYDLERPVDFAREVHEVLADDGIWVFEQSYMPEMLRQNSFDTVCHEHLEYYGLRQIVWIAEKVGFFVRDVAFNSVNGGSFSVTVAKSGSERSHAPIVRDILLEEEAYEEVEPFAAFARAAESARTNLRAFLEEAQLEGKSVAALGASTKGNVLLQYCSLTASEVIAVGEVNRDKFGHYTPRSNIPIVPEDELLDTRPDYLLVLPWHFKEFFLSAKKFKGLSLVFPLPELSIVTPG